MHRSFTMLRRAAGLALLLLVAAVARADQAEDQFNFATGLFIGADYEMAVAEYETFLKNHPQHKLAGDAQWHLGESFMRLEEYEKAIAPLESYLKRKETDPARRAAARFRLGKAYAEQERPKEAARHYADFVNEFPDHKLAPAARYWAGECALRAGDAREAAVAFEGSLNKDKGGRYEPYSLYGLGSAQYELKQYEAAAKSFNRVVDAFGQEEFAADAALKAAQCYEALERPDDALKAYERALREFPQKLSFESQLGRAWVLYRTGDLAKAADLFAAAARQSPDHAQADVARFNAGSTLYNLGQHERALAFFDGLAGKEGRYGAASLYWKGMCLLRLDKPQEALAPLREAADQVGEYGARARFATAEALGDTGDSAKAQEAYEAVANAFPDDELADDALHAAAATALGRGAAKEALALARRLAERHPDSPLRGKTEFIVAEALFKQGEFARAAQVFQGLQGKAVEGVPEGSVLYKLAWCAYRQGRLEEAAKIFARVAADHGKGPLAGESLYMAGKLLADLGRYDEAKKLYLQCMQQHPASPAARSAAYAAALADFGMKEWDRAAAGFKVFLAKYPEGELRGEARFYLAEALLALDAVDEARIAYQAVVQQHPEGAQVADALFGAAWCLALKGEHDRAAAAFEDVAGRFRDSPVAARALYRAGHSRMETGAAGRARELFEKALKATGAEKVAADATYGVAASFLREEQYDRAVQGYMAFLQKFPESPRWANALYDMAWACKGKGDETAAADYFQRVVKEAGDGRLKADALFRLAEARYAAEDHDEAARLYAEITRMDGVDLLDKVYYKLGWSHEKGGRWQEALAAYSVVVKDHGTSELAADAALRSARMLQQLDRHQEAAAALAELLERKGLAGPLAARARFDRAESLRSLEQWGEALRLYKALARPDSGFEPKYLAHYGAGVCAVQVGAKEDARGAFARVIELTEAETAARAQLALGRMLEAEEKFPEAAREYLKVSILYGYPKWKAEGLLCAGRAFVGAGQNDRAKRYLKQLMEEYPDSEAAPQAEKLLRDLP